MKKNIKHSQQISIFFENEKIVRINNDTSCSFSQFKNCKDNYTTGNKFTDKEWARISSGYKKNVKKLFRKRR